MKTVSELIVESIAHWQVICDTQEGEYVAYGAHECALCGRFLMDGNYHTVAAECVGCPIQKDTGHLYCKGTPYDAFSDEMDMGDNSEMVEGARDQAYLMLEYLQILLLHAQAAENKDMPACPTFRLVCPDCLKTTGDGDVKSVTCDECKLS
jgi:hypothetical protein